VKSWYKNNVTGDIIIVKEYNIEGGRGGTDKKICIRKVEEDDWRA
jgi:hypothetical protein